MRRMCLLLFLLAALFTGAAWAETTFDFTCITNNAALSCLQGETYAHVGVIGNGDSYNFGAGGTANPDANQVLFRFFLDPALPAGVSLSIADVYFDDGALLGIASIFETPGVDFSQGATPADLPGGNNANPDFVTTAGFSADSNPPVSGNGVNAFGESLGILFNLKSTKTVDDVLAGLSMDPALTGSLRIGIHVQGFSNGKSEALITGGGGPPELVPEPGTTWLLGMGIGLIAAGAVYRRMHAVR